MSLNRRQRRMLGSEVRTEVAKSPEVRSIHQDIAERAVTESVIENRDVIERLMTDSANKVMRSYLGSEQFASMLRKKLDEAAEPILAEILGEWIPKLEERVRATVTEEFESRVEAEAHKVLTTALAEVRKKFC